MAHAHSKYPTEKRAWIYRSLKGSEPLLFFCCYLFNFLLCMVARSARSVSVCSLSIFFGGAWLIQDLSVYHVTEVSLSRPSVIIHVSARRGKYQLEFQLFFCWSHRMCARCPSVLPFSVSLPHVPYLRVGPTTLYHRVMNASSLRHTIVSLMQCGSNSDRKARGFIPLFSVLQKCWSHPPLICYQSTVTRRMRRPSHWASI